MFQSVSSDIMEKSHPLILKTIKNNLNKGLIVYTYNVIIHLNKRMMNSWQVLKNYTIVAIQGGKQWEGKWGRWEGKHMSL